MRNKNWIAIITLEGKDYKRERNTLYFWFAKLFDFIYFKQYYFSNILGKYGRITRHKKQSHVMQTQMKSLRTEGGKSVGKNIYINCIVLVWDVKRIKNLNWNIKKRNSRNRSPRSRSRRPPSGRARYSPDERCGRWRASERFHSFLLSTELLSCPENQIFQPSAWKQFRSLLRVSKVECEKQRKFPQNIFGDFGCLLIDYVCFGLQTIFVQSRRQKLRSIKFHSNRTKNAKKNLGKFHKKDQKPLCCCIFGMIMTFLESVVFWNGWLQPVQHQTTITMKRNRGPGRTGRRRGCSRSASLGRWQGQGAPGAL